MTRASSTRVGGGNPYQVEVRQLWADDDPRSRQRMIEVVELDDTHAVVETVRTGEGQMVEKADRRRTRIRLSRFHPGSNGYRLVSRGLR